MRPRHRSHAARLRHAQQKIRECVARPRHRSQRARGVRRELRRIRRREPDTAPRIEVRALLHAAHVVQVGAKRQFVPPPQPAHAVVRLVLVVDVANQSLVAPERRRRRAARRIEPGEKDSRYTVLVRRTRKAQLRLHARLRVARVKHLRTQPAHAQLVHQVRRQRTGRRQHQEVRVQRIAVAAVRKQRRIHRRRVLMHILAKHRVARTHVPVHARAPLVVVVRRRRIPHQVLRRIRWSRNVIRQQRLRHRVDPRRIDDVALERLPRSRRRVVRCRVVELHRRRLCQQFAKVPAKHRRRRHRRLHRALQHLPPPLVVPKGEQLVVQNRRARRPAKLVAVKRRPRRARHVEVVVRVERIVAHILEQLAVKLVRAALRHHRHRARRGRPLRRQKEPLVNLELVNRRHRKIQRRLPQPAPRRRHAVDVEPRHVLLVAVNHDRAVRMPDLQRRKVRHRGA